ncbi:MAG: DUF1080 domain-containing protein [Verrucomicrobiales bacterium]|nr:DUF1080 domain-containing protein [Verrucomicrobiales bacterium]
MTRLLRRLSLFGGGALLALSAFSHAGDGYVPLFNGINLEGWQGNPKFWSVRDGAITGQTTADNPTRGNTFLVWQGGDVADFVLRLKFKIVPNNDQGFGNSGIQYRSRLVNPANWVVNGYQADFEAGKTYSGILYEEGGRGILALRGKKVLIKADGSKEELATIGDSDEIQAAIKPRDWNDYTIVARGNHLAHYINGRLTMAVTDEQADKAAKSGILALQLHAGQPMTVQFKDIQLKKLGATKNVVFIAGGPSHGPGEHEHRAGLMLLQKCLDGVKDLDIRLYSIWPEDPGVLDAADAIVVYSDGGAGHIAIQGERLAQLRNALERGAGFGCIHYACEVPKERGGQEWLDFIGGYFEMYWSVNPHWDADFDSLPTHAVTRGVNPFKMRDEWYYHMRFQTGGVTPILSDLPPKETLNRPDGPHSGNPEVRAAVLDRKEPQHVMWLYDRPDKGRGFGFTGGHFHKNWAQDDFRKVVLNAIVWISGLEVPPNGVESHPTPEDLVANQDKKGR